MDKYYIMGQVILGIAILGFFMGETVEHIMLAYSVATAFFVQGIYKKLG